MTRSTDWSPSNPGTDNQSCTMVRRIDHGNGEPRDVVTRLRGTILGFIYTKYLKKYAFIHSFVRSIPLRLLHRMYITYKIYFRAPLTSPSNMRWRELTRLSEYAKKNNSVTTCKLADASVVETPKPKVYPASGKSYLVKLDNRYTFPEIYVATIKHTMIYGGTSMVLKGEEVLCHDLYDFDLDYTAEELRFDTIINPKTRHVRWLLNDNEPEHIQVAATFIDACALNYAHWMSEVLPRVALFCSEKQFNNVPIVVNDGLHRNILESLFWIAGTEREIIILSNGSAVAVDELHVVSVTGYVPFDKRTGKHLGCSHGLFSSHAFNVLRTKLGLLVKDEPNVWPEKILIRRISGARNLSNQAEIESLLVEMGYAIVEPEKLTFKQQIKLFSNASTIIGSAGAALANIIFTPSNAKIFILIGAHPDMIYGYWQNVACSSGKEISYVVGEIDGRDYLGVHSDFRIDPNDLLDALNA